MIEQDHSVNLAPGPQSFCAATGFGDDTGPIDTGWHHDQVSDLVGPGKSARQRV
jgi:hypothetical protein